MGANICYEAIMPEYMRALAVNGAQVFVNATNDSWFGPTQEPWQHLQLAKLRSIENRIPMVRATNTGISTVISITGRTLAIGPLFESANIEAKIPLAPTALTSFYRQWGECFAWLLVALSTLVCFIFEFRRRNINSA
jgi:apolipoprotein N-acyltransferase